MFTGAGPGQPAATTTAPKQRARRNPGRWAERRNDFRFVEPTVSTQARLFVTIRAMILQLPDATSETRAGAVIHAPGKLDIVVVCKLDHLSCSLLDVVKLMDRFNRANIAAGSVPEHFSTAHARF